MHSVPFIREIPGRRRSIVGFLFILYIKPRILFPGIDHEGEVAYISIIIKLVLFELIF